MAHDLDEKQEAASIRTKNVIIAKTESKDKFWTRS